MTNADGDAGDARPPAPRRVALSTRLAATRFQTDSVSHIDTSGLRAGTPAARAVIAVCPAGVYREQGEGVVADPAACLECGACLAVAPGALRWTYPRGGFGVDLRQG